MLVSLLIIYLHVGSTSFDIIKYVGLPFEKQLLV